MPRVVGKTRNLPVVYVYDPNAFNPYGTELASVLSAKYRVIHLAHGESTELANDACDRVVVFDRSASAMVRFLRVIIGISFSRAAVILCWVPSGRHLAVAQLLTRLSRRVFFVDHNPLGSRASMGPISISQREKLFSRSNVFRVLHYGCGSDNSFHDGLVYHPSYSTLTSGYSSSAISSRNKSGCLFFGSARSDKGISYLPEISQRLVDLGVNLRIRVGKCTPKEAEFLRDSAADVVVGLDRHLSDGDIIAEIRRAKVVVAPYSEVTMSGTAILAASVGTPVVMFDSPAMSWLIPKSNMVPAGDLTRFCNRVAELSNMDDGSETKEQFRMTAVELDTACLQSWQHMLSQVG